MLTAIILCWFFKDIMLKCIKTYDTLKKNPNIYDKLI